MSKCKLSLWQKVRGLFIRHQYERTIKRLAQMQNELDKLNYKKSDYWL